MNDNEHGFSNTPYKATGNLNTAIGNPSININSAVTSNIMESNTTSSNYTNNLNTNVNDDDDSISGFINKVNESNYNIDDKQIETNKSLVSSSNVDISNTIFSNKVENNSSYSNDSEVKYENVYGSVNKINKKKSIKIPNEFKTAIFVVLILLIVLSCFESIYDFFRNLNIFG